MIVNANAIRTHCYAAVSEAPIALDLQARQSEIRVPTLVAVGNGDPAIEALARHRLA